MSEQRVTLTLPAELAAEVGQAWQQLVATLPHDMPVTEYWAIRAAGHKAMAAACNKLANALTSDGLMMALAVSAGRDLACWCPVGQPCHADVLLEIANGSGEGSYG